MTSRANNPFFEFEPGGREAAPGSLGLVQAFVNTREAERDWDAIGDPHSLRSWLAKRDLIAEGARVEGADVGRTQEVREALRAMLAANNSGGRDAGAAEVLDRAAERAGLSVRFDAGGGSRLEPAADGVDGALGHILVAVLAGMRDGTWGRLKTCGNGVCAWAFYDRSRNRSSRWCSMNVCGNRTKTRAYRRRKAETS